MTTRPDFIIESADVDPVRMGSGCRRRTLVHGKDLMLCLFELDRGAAIDPHDHVHEQAGVVLRGEVALRVGDEERVLRAGGAYIAPTSTPHAARFLQDTLVLDAFTPSRRDYAPDPGSLADLPAPSFDRRAVREGPRFAQSDEAERIAMFPGFFRQDILWTDHLLLCRFTLEKGTVLPSHRHVHEQAGYVVSGAVELTVDGQSYVTRAGCSYFLTSNREHGARALEDSIVIDAFAPAREDYLRSKAAPNR